MTDLISCDALTNVARPQRELVPPGPINLSVLMKEGNGENKENNTPTE